MHPCSLQRVLRVGQNMPLDSDEFQEAALERSLGQEFQVPHFGVFRKSQSFSRTARERYIYLKHRRKSSKKNQTIHSKYHQHEAISRAICATVLFTCKFFRGFSQKAGCELMGCLDPVPDLRLKFQASLVNTQIAGGAGLHPTQRFQRANSNNITNLPGPFLASNIGNKKSCRLIWKSR